MPAKNVVAFSQIWGALGVEAQQCELGIVLAAFEPCGDKGPAEAPHAYFSVVVNGVVGFLHPIVAL
jgi:hypothetical protein